MSRDVQDRIQNFRGLNHKLFQNNRFNVINVHAGSGNIFL